MKNKLCYRCANHVGPEYWVLPYTGFGPLFYCAFCANRVKGYWAATETPLEFQSPAFDEFYDLVTGTSSSRVVYTTEDVIELTP